MGSWLKNLDRVLRGEATRLAALRGEDLDIPAGGLSAVVVVLAMLYGVCMGCYAVFQPGGPIFWQMLASTLKAPALFYLTLAVTFPSLYVFNTLVGSRLSIPAVFRLLIASLAVNVAVLASFGPIVAFFSLSTTSYPFMVLLNVAMFAVSGGLGLAFLLQTLHRMTLASRLTAAAGWPATMPTGDASSPPQDAGAVPAQLVEEPGALETTPGHVLGKQVKMVFNCWVVIFALVGAQMGWVLRPFIGAPGTPFEWFRERKSNFFQAVLQTLAGLFS
jgi:hypothetical protein